MRAVAKERAERKQNANWQKERWQPWAALIFISVTVCCCTDLPANHHYDNKIFKKCRDCIDVNPSRKNKMQEDTKDKRFAIYSCPYLVEWYLDKQDNIFVWSSMVFHKTTVGKQSQCIQVYDHFHNNRRYTHLFATAQPLCNTFLSLCRNICWSTSQLNKK